LHSEWKFNKIFDEKIPKFLFKKLEEYSRVKEFVSVKYFDRGTKWIIEREGEDPIELNLQEHSAKVLIKKENYIESNFEMIIAMFEHLADKMAEQQFGEIIKTLQESAGHEIDAKGDFLGGLIEAVEKIQVKNGSKPILILHPKMIEKLALEMLRDPERAEKLRKTIMERFKS